MKNQFVLIALLILASVGNSQAQVFVELDQEEWVKFKKEQLYVVLESNEDSEFNQAMKDALAESWTFNDVEFIDSSKIEELQVPGNFFLFQFQYNGKEGKTKYKLNQLELKNVNKRGKLSIAAYVFQEGMDSDYSSEINLTHLSLYIRSLQDLSMKGVDGEGRASVKERTKMMATLKEKPLYILDIHYNEQMTNLSDVKESYSGEVIEISQDDLAEKIKEGEDANLFVYNNGLDKTAPVLRNRYGMAYVFNLQTGEMIYYQKVFNSKKIPKGVSKYLCRVWSK